MEKETKDGEAEKQGRRECGSEKVEMGGEKRRTKGRRGENKNQEVTETEKKKEGEEERVSEGERKGWGK